MLRLLLFRHGKSGWGDQNLSDFDRPLKGRGQEAARLIGDFIARSRLEPDLVLVSPALRAHQTLTLVAKEFMTSPEVRYDERLYQASARDLMAALQKTPNERASLMIVGHNPGLHQLALQLIKEGAEEDIDRLVQKFPTAGLAILDFEEREWRKIGRRSARLHMMVTPKMLISADDGPGPIN